MRIGVDLGVPATGAEWRAWRDAAAAADRCGLDGVLVGGSPDADALVLAASLAQATRDVHVIATAAVGLHPVHLAERIAVADQALAGRLIVALDTGGDRAVAEETVAILDRALSGRRFRHEGTRWRIPAELHGPASPQDIRLTPATAALDVPIWLNGDGAVDVAASLSRTWLPRPEDTDAAAFWSTAHVRGVRPALRHVARSATGEWAIAETVSSLQHESDEWGLSFAILSTSSDHRIAVVADVERLARAVRPRLQMSSVPAGLDRFWVETGIDD